MRILWIALAVLVCQRPGPAGAGAPPIDPFIAGYVKQHGFSGTIVIQNRGKLSYARSFGFANLALKVPNTPRTRYKIASITKAFTAVLILQLRDAGLLDLGKTIGAYLPGYAGPARDKVTIHQLLDHTSGITNMENVGSTGDPIAHGLPVYQLPHTSDELLAAFCSGPLVHPPGTAFDYNNGDYVILGKIIEQITGKPYDQVLHQRILDPLHLDSTGVVHQQDIIPELAETYFRRDGKTLGNDLPVYPENWYAAGAMYATAHDLLAFANALFGGKLVSAASLALMIQPGLDDYGYGVWSYDMKIGGATHHIVKRPGRIMGAQTQLFHVVAPDITIVVLGNTDATDLDELVAELGRRLVG
jgi:D-alanyl-D-alanine carboxypeptidase